MMNKDDDYDVNNYTDNELYDILELVNPSDSILEAKIIQMINKFNSMNNRYGITLATFFTNIYKRFFDVPMDDEIEGFANIESKKYDEENQKFVLDPDAPSGIAYETDLQNLKQTGGLTYYNNDRNEKLAPGLENILSSYDNQKNQYFANPNEIQRIAENNNLIAENNDLQIGFEKTTTPLENTSTRQFKQIDM